ncbi:hypothetical protein GGR56DRAFT_272566 [Xylariaceae sp. FL0804]|nr:hypothetical protein GGR56DRAFT_272566 [Xylariaceae sp. FL0804]
MHFNAPHHSRLPPSSSAGHDDAPANKAALKGATLAFQKTAQNPQRTPASAGANRGNGALIAATSASRDHSLSTSPSQTQSSQLSRQNTSSNAPGRLEPNTERGNKHGMADPRAPSFIAATLAASRSASPSPNAKAQSHPYVQQATRMSRRGSIASHSAASSANSLDLATDSTPIPPTNALISMFEKGGDNREPVKRKQHQPPGVKPKPRLLTPPRALSPVAKHEICPSRLASTLAWERAATPPASTAVTASEKRQQNSPVDSRKHPPSPPPTRKKGDANAATPAAGSLETRGKPRASTPPTKHTNQAETPILSPQPRRFTPQRFLTDQSGPFTTGPQNGRPPAVKPKPQRPPSAHGSAKSSTSRVEMPRRDTSIRHRRSSSSSSTDTFVSAPSKRSLDPDSPRRGRLRPPASSRPQSSQAGPTQHTSSSVRSSPAPRRRPDGPSLPLDSLTSAIVAGSLASARATPSAVAPPSPPPRKQTPHMRQTLRKSPSKSDDEGTRARSRHRKKPLHKLHGKKKHTHHEGSRKRWREEITPRERKRYEGVWASNRGLLLSSGDGRPEGEGGGGGGQMVVNVVVRDLWSRSRLPFDELGEVWDLVDHRGRGMLDKAEFVVGMWLIDQRLRGRKIPQKVSDSVWGSARDVRDVRISGPKARKR